MRTVNHLMLLGPDSAQAPFLAYDYINTRWRVWQTFLPDLLNGTYIDLYDDGRAERVTVKDGITQDIVILTGPVTWEQLNEIVR